MAVVSKYTYTLETIIQAGKLLIATDHVPVRTNAQTRESRLFPSMGSYVRRNALAITRIYAQYEPLKVFLTLSLALFLIALVPFGRFAIAYASGNGAGHVQSLIFGAVLFNASVVLAALGILGDLLFAQRIMAQRIFERVRRIELQLGVAPSHYEPGATPTGSRRPRGPRPARRPPSARPSRHDAPRGDGRRRGDGHRQHLRQVRLDQPGRPPAHVDLRAHARRAVDPGRPAVAARRGLRRGRADPPVGAGPRRPPDRRHRPRGPAPAGRVGHAAAPEPRVPGHEGRADAVRGRRVRPGRRDRGPRARARPGAHGGRDGARRLALAARVRAARAALARAEPRPRRVRARPRQHARAPQPLEPARVRRAPEPPRRRRRSPVAVPWTMLLVRVGD